MPDSSVFGVARLRWVPLLLLERLSLQGVQGLRARDRFLALIGEPHAGIVVLRVGPQLSRGLRRGSMQGFRAHDPLAAFVRPA